MYAVVLGVIGVIAGYLARLLMPGRDKLTFLQTVFLGVAGSFIGGFFAFKLFDQNLADGPWQPSSILPSMLGAMLLLLIKRAVSGKKLMG